MIDKNVAVVGDGEIGRAISIVESNRNQVYVFDKKYDESFENFEAFRLNEKDSVPIVCGTGTETLKECGKSGIEVLNICIPFNDYFLDDIIYYKEFLKPELIIIHSTVLPGTTENVKKALDDIYPGTSHKVVHSPVMGKHPNLVPSLYQFKKIVGAPDRASFKKAEDHIMSLGIGVEPFFNARNSELAKILSTTYYGWNILFAKEAQKLCDYYNCDFEQVYTTMNEVYNEGYEGMGMQEVTRPILQPPYGKIGGHCVSQNVEFLPEVKLKKHFKDINEEGEDEPVKLDLTEEEGDDYSVELSKLRESADEGDFDE